MIYRPLSGTLLWLLRAPPEPPEAPAGSPGSVRVFRASPKFLSVRLIQVGLLSAVMLLPEAIALVAALVAGHPGPAIGLTVVLLAAIGFVLVHWFLVRLDYDMRYYLVTDRSLRIRQGALVIRESTFTFANVQNVAVHQGPIDRLVGIANVRIETAGGGAAQDKQNPFISHRGVLAGIDHAQEVRDRILDLLKAYRDAGLGDHEDRRPTGRAGPGLGEASLERLREIRSELAALRASLER